jgi:uncharacterized protein
MLDSIERVQNPRIRGAVAGGLVFTIVTLVSGIVISATDPNAKADRVALPSYAIGIVCGVLFGTIYAKKTVESTATDDRDAAPADKDKLDRNWRNFVVDRQVKETEKVTSFYLKPEDKGSIPKFEAGQFITLKLNGPGQQEPVIRPYSLSDYADPIDYYRISINREEAPPGSDVPPGVASTFMHEKVHQGNAIAVQAPSGQFTLDNDKSTPVVLISMGIGLTPFVSIAKACSRINPHRPIWFLHGTTNGQTHVFRDEVLAIAKENANLHIHFRYSHPRSEDKDLYNSVGHIDTELVKTLVGKDADFYLCGSPPFQESLQKGLKEWGVADDRISYESFYERSQALAQGRSSREATAKAVEQAEVTFAKSGKTLTWHNTDGTILEFAEANGLQQAYSCRQGICGTCMCKIQAGSIAYQTAPTAQIDPGSVLICISKSATPKVVLDV